MRSPLLLAAAVFALALSLAPEPAAARVPGYGDLGPRGTFHWEDYAGMPHHLWSGKVLVKLAEPVTARLQGRTLVDPQGRVLLRLHDFVAPATLHRVDQGFGMDPTWLRSLQRTGQARCGCEVADLSTYFALYLDKRAVSLPGLLRALNAVRTVELAYPTVDKLQLPLPVDLPPTTPDYSASQLYDGPAPDGVDAVFAAAQPGGDGAGVAIADIEIGWQTDHEDLETCVGGLVNVGTLYEDDYAYIDHGTAVLGQIFAGHNGYGVNGLSPGATCYYSPDFTWEYGGDVPRAMLAAMNQVLQVGDVMLLEAQTYGPNYDDQTGVGLVPVEWDTADYDTIRNAVTNGYIVVEAGANGYQDLDDPIYNGRFDRAQHDTGAIMVAAGTPPTDPPAHRPEYYTNYGSRMDAHAYGSLVFTTGYGDLFDGGGDLRQRYTSQFAGTSSASPIVTGAVALYAAVMRQRGENPTPVEIRTALHDTGTPQAPDARNIGTQPDLRAALGLAAECGDGVVEGAEVCDDGNTVAGDGCSADCLSDESCGNGTVDTAAGEMCDDGNVTAGDGCSSDCRSDETCGNGVVDAVLGEACDDGPGNDWSPDACRPDCTAPTCGDWVTDPGNGEQCDDGNSIDDDTCNNRCRRPGAGGGCGCRTGGGPGGAVWLLTLLLLLARIRRKQGLSLTRPG